MGISNFLSIHDRWLFLLMIVVLFSFWMIEPTDAELTPPYFNLATERKIYATATCGVDTDEPELYCKLVGANSDNQYYSVIQGQVCDTCDPSRPDKNHPPENAIDGKENWWQSPPLSRGMKYNEVNLTIDFGQEFHVAYLFIRMGNSPRPGLWTLEKSSDYGKTWSAWQHFSDTPADCETYFGKDSLRPIIRDDDVICTTEYSKIVPLENGEIPVMLLNNRPSANNYFNSSVLQEWTRATNIRIRLLRTKNLLGHLMSVARQDPTVTRRYFYSIKDISIGGRCMCNGHADTCDVADPKSRTRLLACICQHHTCGIQCNECCPGFEQKKWSQNTNARPFQCEPCNCFGHSNKCEYNEETDNRSLSLDIHGRYEGGGVCQNCQHNTEGINCNKCKPKFYRPWGKNWNETDVCRRCNCDYHYSTGNCEEETGRCECRVEYKSPNCDACAYGYFDYPYCRECECFLNGTQGYYCETQNGICPCKPNFAGDHCKQCANGYFGFPKCDECRCNEQGSVSNTCDQETGVCKCLNTFGGERCERCKHGYFSYPECKYCDCDIKGTVEEICEKETGKCVCRKGFSGPRCDQCEPGFYNYPDCVPCNCSTIGSTSIACDSTGGKCSCLLNFVGKRCDSCSAGYYAYPECLPCNCQTFGSAGISCNPEGQCLCMDNFDGKKCERCKEGFYNFPACEECNCNPAGVIVRFAGCAGLPAGELCQCKDRVTGRICDRCQPLFWNLNISNPDGCESCDCNLDGTIGGLDTCDWESGQCHCKPSVNGRQCTNCKDGTFDLFGGSLFGCKNCGCDIGGARNELCDKQTGQCNCHSRIAGRTCSSTLTTHYFPTLYQFQYEYEDGYTPSGAHVRYQYDEDAFANFSRKGYAEFSNIQSEVINEVNIFKSSVYRVIIRYVNPTSYNVTANILITSDNPTDPDQHTKVVFNPTQVPQFVTVSGPSGDIPFPFVLDPGRYTVSIKTEKNILLDYFVLLPAAYYEASILTRQIENPCEIDSSDVCRHYAYPSITAYKPSFDPFIIEGDVASKPTEYYEDPEHLQIINEKNGIPLITDSQRSLKYLVDVPSSGRYFFVIDYVTDRSTPDTYYIKVRVNDEEDFGIATLYPCLYTTICRQPVIDDDSKEKLYYIDEKDLKPIDIYHNHDDFGKVAIKSVTAIPADRWSIDLIEPSNVCVMKDGQCVSSDFRTAPDSKKVEFHLGHEGRAADKGLSTIYDNSTKLILLNQYDPSIEIRSKVSEPGRYAVLLKYYQPNHPEFKLLFVLTTEKSVYEGKVLINHCPSNSGCRQIIRPEKSTWWFDIEDEFTFTITNNQTEEVLLEYILIVPFEQYNENLLQEETFDQTKEFIQKCGQDHFYIQLNASEFCKKTVFSLTADYNDGALPCNCDYDGSTSFECDPFGGQCQCKPNVIGRQCEACRTGFYGFPDCKHCDCPLTALCQKDTGECICPPHVTGEKCDQCEPYTYGFHQIIGCEECNCNPLGVERGNLQCDLNNGTCNCRPNIEGRPCDHCDHGHYNFPHCEVCRCNLAGTTFEICDKNDESCFCKKNVVGRTCDRCAEGTYNLESTNPEGCTKCFCFGKTTRCDSVFLRTFNVSLLGNVSINTVIFDGDIADLTKWNIPEEDIFVNETTLQADYQFKDTEDGLTYFGVLNHFLNQNNHLTAYGGYLVYTLYYTTGIFAKPIFGPDVILHGHGITVTHQNYEQPANAQIYRVTVKMVESSFQTLDKKPVSRADFMMILRDLAAVYIRASYWDQTVISQLSDIYLTIADEDENNYHLYKELPVEKCHCPLGYNGLSCENCAPGYYRDLDGPYGGYCVPCDCNGHAESCDCNTGICQNCKHFTTGDHCELCIEGHYGNATYGTPNDCMICACPLPYESNNFASSCEISESGYEIHCECRYGYTGPRCESCAPGFYGQPEKLGDVCKPCDCSGNIKSEEPGSCDTVTGECLQCLNNTYGRACNLCAPGFYGDAIKLKDCKSCDCEELGTAKCDSFVGTCECHENVIGERCDRCEEDHYGYDSGLGCRICDCGVASNSSQCDDHTGACACKTGVAGRTCDRCDVDHWNYTADGCIPCKCNRGYSRGFGCNTLTGQCQCLPGVIGEKCDACPWRWVLIKDQGCFECDGCHHALLNVTDALKADIDPIVSDFQSVALAFFTSQKLNFYDNWANEIEPKVRSLDPKGVNLMPASQNIESLEQDTKNMVKQISYAEESAKDRVTEWNKLLTDAGEVLGQSSIVNINTKNTIHEVENLAKSLDNAATTKAENAVDEAQQILDELKAIEFSAEPASELLTKSKELYDGIKLFSVPADTHRITLNQLKENIKIFNEKLGHLQNWSAAANLNSGEVNYYNQKNKESFENSQFDTVSNQTKATEKNIDDTKKLIINGHLSLETIGINLGLLNDTLDQLKQTTRHVDEVLPKAYEEYHNVSGKVHDSTLQAENLKSLARNLAGQYSNATSNSETAIKAANAYSDILNAVQEAEKAVRNAKNAAGNATELGDGVRERANRSEKAATSILTDAQKSLNAVQGHLEPHLNRSSQAVQGISNLNQQSSQKLDDVNRAIETFPRESQRKIWQDAHDKSEKAHRDAKAALEILKPIVAQTPKDLETARNMPKDVDITNKDIIQTKSQVDRVRDLVPELTGLVDTLDKKQVDVNHVFSNIGDQIKQLKQQVEKAREIANSIKVGVTFQPNTVLELKTPENVELLGTTSKISAYFNTQKQNGFLLYLGNENKTDQRSGKAQDFMAIQIQNGYPVLSLDVGNGPEKIINQKYIADGQWYQAIVDRTGNNVRFTIREELDNGTEKLHETEEFMRGPFTVFNLNKDSKLFIGGYPPDFTPPEEIRYNTFEGQVEDLRIGDDSIGLWSFNYGQDLEGAITRDRLITQETPATGYRFNGNGYVALDARQYSFKSRSSIHFQFKASADTRDGLMFYAGQEQHFISVELNDGNIAFQYKLGEHLVRIATGGSFNDGEWHRVEADRDGRKGLLKLDGQSVYQRETPIGTEEILKIGDTIYIGGYPHTLNHTEVIKQGFDGCIDDVQIAGTPIDLSQHLAAIGVRQGCPEKFSTVLSYPHRQFGFLKKSNVTSDNNFEIALKFKTKQRDGVIFYATNHDQSATIGLALLNGSLTLTSMLQQLSSNNDKYNDGEWHVVTVTHDKDQLRLSVDDTNTYRGNLRPPPLHIKIGDIYFGGLPTHFIPARGSLSTTAYFTGCINDVTLNGEIVNFASSTDKQSATLDNCPANILDYDVSSVPIFYPGSVPGNETSLETIGSTARQRPDSEVPPKVPPTINKQDDVSSTQKEVFTVPVTRLPDEPPSECFLPADSEIDVHSSVGYRFGTAENSRVEYNSSIGGKVKRTFDFSLDFKTDGVDGILFYGADERNIDFLSLYLQNGKVHFVFKSNSIVSNVSSRFNYDDGNWHSVIFGRQQTKVRLTIDGIDENYNEVQQGTRSVTVKGYFFVGGLDPTIREKISSNLNIDEKSYFDGCIKKVEHNGRELIEYKAHKTIHCSDKVEKGVYFGKDAGWVKLRDNFRVGREMTISFDIRPRASTGFLLSVHGRKALLVLEIINGTINFTVDNGDGPIVATFPPAPGESFCDGQWRPVQAIKSLYVITLTVNSTASQPAIGRATSSFADTSRPLFLGGHPHLAKLRGITARKGFLGCIRNVKIKDQEEIIRPEMTSGDVQTGVCPSE